MASREASLKVTLQPASFQAGLRRMQTMTVGAGRTMGRALKEPMTKGIKAAQSEFKSMLGGMKSGIATIATLGGALSFGALVKDALTIQNTYRNLAFLVSKNGEQTKNWKDIQALVNDEVNNTGRSADELAESFRTIFEATGDFTAAANGMKIVGTTATATGHSIGALSTAVQMSIRKFSIGPEGLEDAMTRFIEKTGVGGKSIEEMSNRFGVMAGEASDAGITGASGISELLGMMLLLDNSIGEKADPGLTAMFQTIKGGTSTYLKLKKDMGSGIEFKADMHALDKIRATLESEAGRASADVTFTAGARSAYDAFTKPFKLASEEAIAQGESTEQATKKGLAAFDKAMAAVGHSTMKYSKIQDEAASRQGTDPMIRMTKAMNQITTAFAQPKMIDALNKLADKMPAFANAVASTLDIILDNPWETIAVVVGGKIALAFAGSAISSAIATGVTGLFGRMAAVQAATSAASVATAGATSLGVGGAVAGAGGAGAVAAAAATVAAGVLAAGAVGGAIGTAYYEYGAGGKESEMGEAAAMRRAGEATVGATNVVSGGNKQEMQEALFELGQAKTHLKNNESFLRTVMGSLAAATTEGLASPEQVRDEQNAKIVEAEQKLKRALQDMEDNSLRAAKAIRTLGDAADSTRGPMTPVDPSPGASPIRG